MLDWEHLFEAFLSQRQSDDIAHDLGHIRRVVANGRWLAGEVGADLAVVLPAAWLHDCVKDAPRRRLASRLAADTAVAFLRHEQYPADHLPAIHHAIVAHSFTAAVPPQTLEAQVVQDADRLDALGAIGIARTCLVGGGQGRPLYHFDDPFADERPPDDGRFVLDHFYVKLLTLADTMHTAAARREAQARTTFMRRFLRQLGHEIVDHRGGDSSYSASIPIQE